MASDNADQQCRRSTQTISADIIKLKSEYFNSLFVGLYVHRFSGQRDRIPTARLGWLLPEFFHDRLSSERNIPAQACRFSCFFCAAYGLLLTQTRTQCSNSASRAITLLEKSAKISPNAWTVVSRSGECRSCRKLLHFCKRYNVCGLFAHTAPIKMAIATHVEQTICTDQSPSRIKVQISPLVRAYLWQIFAGLASIAIALKTLFERRARVCLKSNL